MANEILECDLEEFLGHYAPWQVPEATVNGVVELFVEGCKQCKPPLVKEVEADDKATASDGWGFADFELEPGQNQYSEPVVFKALDNILKVLHHEKIKRKLADINRTHLLHYRDCPHTNMESEIEGTNVRVDAYLTSSAGEGGPSSKRIELADVAIPAEFKKRSRDKIQNRHQLVSVVSHIMNDDPRRTWVYGVTIENNMMRIWYFCCSHSVVSALFDFTKNLKFFVHVFLSLMYATREEIGYDPTVHRVMDDKLPRHVYEVKSDSGVRYFKTVETLFASRVLCITGRKTRVWKAVEVEGYEDGEFQNEKNGGRVVALKDYWLDDGSRSEKAILGNIFKRIEQVKNDPTTLQWAKDKVNKEFMKNQLEDERYKKYFMNIECDMILTATKSRLPSAKPVFDFLVSEDNTESASVTKTTGSIQTTNSPMETACVVHQSKGDRLKSSLQREYKMKRHHRLIYEQVGYPLHAAENLSISLQALTDTLIALTLMYLAGYVHRDVSTGNIILVEGPNGTAMGKLSDMEYAKLFGNNESSPDPKTGTLFFMAVEIHSGRGLYISPSSSDDSDDSGDDPSPESFAVAPIIPVWRGGSRKQIPKESYKRTRPKFRFSHDMESLLWVKLYILTKCIPRLGVEQSDDYSHQRFNRIYTNSPTPTYEREEIIRMGRQDFQSFLESNLIADITGFALHLTSFREKLRSSYTNKTLLDKKFHHDSYGPIYDTALRAFRKINNLPRDEMDLKPPMANRLAGSQTASQPKRRRTSEERGDDDYAVGKDGVISVEDLPVRRQPKRGKMDSGQAHLILS